LDKQQRGEAGSWCRSGSAILNKTKTNCKADRTAKNGCYFAQYFGETKLTFIRAVLVYLAFAAPDEGEFCRTEILGNKITLLSCPISLQLFFYFIFFSDKLRKDGQG